MQARLLEHSWLIVHSGRQFGGFPKKVGKHLHTGEPPTFVHSALAPQGDGTQGSRSTTTTGSGGGAKIIQPMSLNQI